MTDTPQEPLWQVMHKAFWKCPKENWRLSSAYMIRAVADWLVPPELENLKPQDPAVRIKWRTGLELRQRLLAEADRAERGDS
jgi:hypothetical protein